MQAGEEYDYFFEVDGELRYDFECDFTSVEIREAAAAAAMAANQQLSPGQIIIANSI